MYMLAHEAINKLHTNNFIFQRQEFERGEVYGAPDTKVDLYKKGKQEVRISYWLNKDGIELCQVVPLSALSENNLSHNP